MKNIALITGSYGGFGSCLANLHAMEGGDLILVGRNQEKLEKQAKQLTEQYHITAKTISVDLSTPEAAQII